MLSIIYSLFVWISYCACSLSHDQSVLERSPCTAAHGPEDDDWNSWGAYLSLGPEPSNAPKRKYEMHTLGKQLTDEVPCDNPLVDSTVNADGTCRGSKKRHQTQPGFLQYSPLKYHLDGTELEHDPFGRVGHLSGSTTSQEEFPQRKRMENVIRTNPEAQIGFLHRGHPPPPVREWPELTELAERNSRRKLPNHKDSHLDNNKNRVHHNWSTRKTTLKYWIRSGRQIKGPGHWASAFSQYDDRKGKKLVDQSPAEPQKIQGLNVATSGQKFGIKISSESESIGKSATETIPLNSNGLAARSWPKIADSDVRLNSFFLQNVDSWLKENTASTKLAPQDVSVYASLEIVGDEIIDKIKFVPKKPIVQNLLQFDNYRTHAKSHAIKAVVTYIEVMNHISEPPLYQSLEQLRAAQLTAIQYVENMWRKFYDRKFEVQANSGVPSLSLPLGAEERFTRLQNYSSFNAYRSNVLGEFCFLLWMREKLPEVYSYMHAHNAPLHWNISLIATLRKYVLTLKSSEEISSALNSVSRPHGRPHGYVKTRGILTYKLLKPFKIEWNFNS